MFKAKGHLGPATTFRNVELKCKCLKRNQRGIELGQLRGFDFNNSNSTRKFKQVHFLGNDVSEKIPYIISKAGIRRNRVITIQYVACLVMVFFLILWLATFVLGLG